MNQISKEALEFLEEAKENMSKNIQYSTYTNAEKGFIGLRSGFRDDCIMIYELGNEVGNFTGQLPSKHITFIEYDEVEALKDLRNDINLSLNSAENLISQSRDTSKNEGIRDALRLVLKRLNELKILK